MENEIKKFNLQDQGRPLQVFIFTIQKGPVAMELDEDMQTILAHDEPSAMQQAQTDFDEMATRLLLPGLVEQFNRPHFLTARAS